MKDEALAAPLLLTPIKIYNYTQLIAALKKKQQKLSKYKTAVQPTAFRNVLRPKQQGFEVDDIVNGFLHSKLRCRQKDHEKAVNKSFSQTLNRQIKELKRENNLFVVGSSKISSKVGDLERVFDKDPAEMDQNESFADGTQSGCFNDAMLFDIYMFLRDMKPSTNFEQEIGFLGAEYLSYIERFLKENADKIRTPLKKIEDKVSTFVRLRYSREEYRLEIYEGRYVFAELYTFFRCGLLDSVLELLEKFHVFFEHISHKFKTSFAAWLATKTRPAVPIKIGPADDLFKVFLLGLMDGLGKKADGYVVGSIEDFVWMQLIGLNELNSVENILELFRDYQNPKGLLLAYVMTKSYDKAMELVFKGDFSIVPSYFVMKALCPKCTNKKVFIDFVFLASTRFSSIQRKVELLDSLRTCVEDYYSIVPEMIVKVGLYDVLGIEDGTCLYLDKRVNSRVIEILKAKNEKKKLIKLYYLIDDEPLMIDLINETIAEAILADMDIDPYFEIVEYYEKREDIRQARTMSMLKSFYMFKKSPELSTLRATPLFNLDHNLSEFRYVVEKIFRLACDVVEREGDSEMAKVLFRLCGTLGLGDEISRYVNRHLILLI